MNEELEQPFLKCRESGSRWQREKDTRDRYCESSSTVAQACTRHARACVRHSKTKQRPSNSHPSNSRPVSHPYYLHSSPVPCAVLGLDWGGPCFVWPPRVRASASERRARSPAIWALRFHRRLLASNASISRRCRLLNPSRRASASSASAGPRIRDSDTWPCHCKSVARLGAAGYLVSQGGVRVRW